MTSLIKFDVLSGAYDEQPPCYLLKVDDFTILLDCGWEEDMSKETIERIKQEASKVDAILLTYPDNIHLGFLPVLVGKCKVDCPIYATVPVYTMGQMFMYDFYQAITSDDDFTLFSLDDVDAAFDKITQLKYMQTICLAGKGQGLQITPICAGHMLGGTVWKIVKDNEEEIVYAIDYNHIKDKHLNGFAFEQFLKPNLLITDSFNVTYVQMKRKLCDEQLVDEIRKSVRNGGNVLIATDSSGRILELAYMLDQIWNQPDSGLPAYHLAMATYTAAATVDFARSHVEWLGDHTTRNIDLHKSSPFQFKHVKLCQSLADVNNLTGPKIVLASHPDLQGGFSRQLFTQWCSDTQNTVIVTQRTSPGTLARLLIDKSDLSTLQLETKSRTFLEGPELDEYWRLKREQLAIDSITGKSSGVVSSGGGGINAIELDSSSSDEENEAPSIEVPVLAATSASGNATTSVHQRHDLRLDEAADHHQLMLLGTAIGRKQGSFFKQTRQGTLMFPHFEKRIKWDDYGEVIDPNDYAYGDVYRRKPFGRGRGGSRAVQQEDIAKPLVEELPNPPIVIKQPGALPSIRNHSVTTTKEAALAEDLLKQPTKIVKNVEEFALNCKVVFIDFEGKSDGDSIKRILSAIKPKNLIVVHGPTKPTAALVEYCSKSLDSTTKIFAPRVNQSANLASESFVYQVRLTDRLTSKLPLQRSGMYDLAWVNGCIAHTNTDEGGEKCDFTTPEDSTKVLNLDTLPGKTSDDGKPGLESHSAIFVNQPKLSDLKQILQHAGFNAEFCGGVLVINDQIAIKRTDAGHFEVEGVICSDYFSVRKLLYSQFALL